MNIYRVYTSGDQWFDIKADAFVPVGDNRMISFLIYQDDKDAKVSAMFPVDKILAVVDKENIE